MKFTAKTIAVRMKVAQNRSAKGVIKIFVQKNVLYTSFSIDKICIVRFTWLFAGSLRQS
jgi:hypothetical protein